MPFFSIYPLAPPRSNEKDGHTSLTCSSASGSAALASSVICSDGTVLSSSFFPDSDEVLAAGRKRVGVVVIDFACRRGRGVIWRGVARVMGRRTEMSLRWADMLIDWMWCCWYVDKRGQEILAFWQQIGFRNDVTDI
jgi:hypothetical protein